jgi:LPS sulfotransferase NodH
MHQKECNIMSSPKVVGLTREDIIKAAKAFKRSRQMPKWTVLIEGKEFPARQLLLNAAGVPPNDSTNSHQAVAVLKELGFETRYEGKSV